jgi:hypothetical protein
VQLDSKRRRDNSSRAEHAAFQILPSLSVILYQATDSTTSAYATAYGLMLGKIVPRQEHKIFVFGRGCWRAVCNSIIRAVKPFKRFLERNVRVLEFVSPEALKASAGDFRLFHDNF